MPGAIGLGFCAESLIKKKRFKMKKYEAPGDILPLVAPAGGVTSGTVYLIGNIVCVALADAAAGETFQGVVRGLFNDLPCKTTDDVSPGDLLYWDDGNSELTLTAVSGGVLCAYAAEASGTSSSVVVAKLTGQAQVAEA